MDEDSPELDVNVRVSSEGAPEAEAAVRRVGEAAEETGNKAGEGLSHAAREMREFTGSTREGQEVVRGLEAAMKGGAGGIGEMIRGVRALTLVITHLIADSGPIGLLLLALGAIVGAMLALSKHSSEAAGEMDKTGTRAEDLQKKIDNLTKSIELGFQSDVEAVKELEATFNDMDKMAEASVARTKELDAEKHKLAMTQMEVSKETALAGATTEEERKKIEENFNETKKLAELKEESRQSDNRETQAKVNAQRSKEELAQLGTVQLSADARARQAESSAESASAKAKSFGSALLDNAKTGSPISEGEEKKRRGLADDAFAAQAAAKKADELRDKVHDDISKAGKKAEDDQSKYQDAKELNAATQERIRAEIQLAASSRKAADALDNLAARAKVSGGDSKADEEGAKGGKESAAEKLSDKAADDHLSTQGEKALEGMASGSKKIKKAIVEHATATAQAHEETTRVLGRTREHVERTSRQLTNASSYDSSP